MLLTAILAAALAGAPAAAQDKKAQKAEKARAEAAAAARAVPVLWRAPDDIASRDLLAGPGGEAMRPDLRRFTFLKEEKGGYSTKYRVKDARGREWVAKVGKEAQSETAAVRLLWAVGYSTEVNYLVPRLTINGMGTFENVRLEARPESVERLDEWKWSENPFVGTKELQGLIISMALFNNWDIKDSNNKLLLVRSGGRGELHYIVSDLGATFGRVHVNVPGLWRISRSRNDPEDYSRDPFLEDVKGRNVFLFYKGKRQDLFDSLHVNEARWIGGLFSKLSRRQVEDAFRAANYTPGEVGLLSAAFRQRVAELAGVGLQQNAVR